MKYEFFKKDDTIFLIDSIGTKFYLILSGKVGVYIRLPNKIQKEEADSPENEEENSLTCVKQLFSGEAFGELALLNNKPRLASIIAHDNTFIAVLDKKDFVLILKEKEEQKLLKEMGFFAKLPFFTGWNFNLVKLLYLNAFRVKYKKGDFVFQEGQEPVAVYIITEGQFDLEKNFEKEKRNEFGETDNQKDINKMRLINKKAKTTLRIASYTPHELFGEEDIMNKISKRTFGAICESATGECIMIKKRDFFLRILREDTAKQYLTLRLQNKNNRMQEKMQNIKEFVHGFQNFLYNDQDGLKKQKEVSQDILKSETFNESAIKKFVQNSNHHSIQIFNSDNNGRESQSPSDIFTQALSAQSPYQNRRSASTFMNLNSLNKQIDHNQPIIPIFDHKRSSLAVNQDSFSPLLKSQKQLQPVLSRSLLKLYSNSSAQSGQGEQIQPVKLVKEQSNEKDIINSKEQLSPDLKNPKQEMIKRFSGLIDVGRFNEFKVQLRKFESSNTQNRLSLQQYTQNTKDKLESFSDLPENTQTNSKTNQQTLNNLRLSCPSVQFGSQTIMENTITQENNNSDESESKIPSSPQLIKSLKNTSPFSRNSKLISLVKENSNDMIKVNNLINPKSSENSLVAESGKNSQRSSFKDTFNTEQKLKIFENIKFKTLSNTNTNLVNNSSANMVSNELKLQNKSGEIGKVLPLIMINSEVSSPFERNKKTPKVANSTKSLGQDELSLYKKSFSQLQSSTHIERKIHSSSVRRNNNLPLYYNQIMLNMSQEDNKKSYQLRNISSVERQNLTPQNNIKSKNSIIQITQSNISAGSMSPHIKRINSSKPGSIKRVNSDGKNILFNKQHVQAGQRIGDIMEKLIQKQSETPHKTQENIQNNSSFFNKKDDNLPFNNNNTSKFSNFNNFISNSNNLKLKDEQLNSFFNGFKNHISVGTQFSSLIKQLDNSRVSQSSQSERINLKQIPKLKLKI